MAQKEKTLGFLYTETEITVPDNYYVVRTSPKIQNLRYVANIINSVSEKDIIINSYAEAPKVEFYQAIRDLVDSRKNIYIIDGSSEPIEGFTHFYSPTFLNYTYFLSNTVIPAVDRKFKFTMPVRWPRLQRVLLLKEFIKRGLVSEGLISFGNVEKADNFNTDILPSDLLSILTPDERSIFPLIIDKANIEEKGPNWNISVYFDNPIFKITKDALINVVCETSFDTSKSVTYPQFYFNNKYCHNRIFITEKTASAIYNRQIPIILSVTGTVEYLRNLGIDMFDDIIDHSYDSEPNPEKRIKMIAQEVEKVCRLQIKELAYKYNLDFRFKNNIKNLQNSYKVLTNNFTNKLNNVFVDSRSLL